MCYNAGIEENVMAKLKDKDLFFVPANRANVDDYAKKFSNYLMLMRRIIIDYMRFGRLSKLTKKDLEYAQNNMTYEQYVNLVSVANRVYTLKTIELKFSDISISRDNIDDFIRFTMSPHGEAMLNKLLAETKDLNWLALIDFFADENNDFKNCYLIDEWSSYATTPSHEQSM